MYVYVHTFFLYCVYKHKIFALILAILALGSLTFFDSNKIALAEEENNSGILEVSDLNDITDMYNKYDHPDFIDAAVALSQAIARSANSP